MEKSGVDVEFILSRHWVHFEVKNPDIGPTRQRHVLREVRNDDAADSSSPFCGLDQVLHRRPNQANHCTPRFIRVVIITGNRLTTPIIGQNFNSTCRAAAQQPGVTFL